MQNNFELLQRRCRKAFEKRQSWENFWRECYEYALPQREGGFCSNNATEKRSDRLFDGTAPDAADQLAASMLARLTPTWAKWFGLTSGVDLFDEEKQKIAPTLEKATEVMRSHFDRSTFAVEMHQCYLDLITVGTASLLFEEAPLGEISAFRFTAIPMSELAFEENASGRLDTTFRRFEASLELIKERFGEESMSSLLKEKLAKEPDFKIMLIESVIPINSKDNNRGYEYTAFIEEDRGLGLSNESDEKILKKGHFASSPFINFRWLKAAGETYGRSPIMKALPDIKTANKVVELVLKNATIAVTGIWLADDDGVLNPSNIKLVPGAIIPKAVGSKGLTPLEAPGRFDISQLVLDDLRKRIRHALLVDRLGQIETPVMTATEVLERSSEMSRILGATYGRLQSELLTPLIMRALSILRRKGEIADIWIDGHLVDLQYRSPLAREQAQHDAANTMSWLSSVSSMGEMAMGAVDMPSAARWLGRTLGVPEDLIKSEQEQVDDVSLKALAEIGGGMI